MGIKGMSEIPPKTYVKSNLIIGPNENNPWLVANKYYSDCMTRFLISFPTKEDAIRELNRGDVNNICKKELGYLRELVPSIRYKEVLGRQNIMGKTFFKEEVEVKNRK